MPCGRGRIIPRRAGFFRGAARVFSICSGHLRRHVFRSGTRIVSDAILADAAAIANQWRLPAAAWHVTAAVGSYGSKPWAILLGSLGLLYGVIGVFVLRVTIAWFLIAGGGALLARAAAPIPLPRAVARN